jgi:reverse gyrase
MRNILAFVGALVVTLVVVGWYENWFQFRTTAGADGNRNISIDIDSKKVSEDVKQTEKKIETFIDEKSKEIKSSTPAAPAPPFNPATQLKDSVVDPKLQVEVPGPSGKH